MTEFIIDTGQAKVIKKDDDGNEDSVPLNFFNSFAACQASFTMSRSFRYSNFRPVNNFSVFERRPCVYTLPDDKRVALPWHLIVVSYAIHEVEVFIFVSDSQLRTNDQLYSPLELSTVNAQTGRIELPLKPSPLTRVDMYAAGALSQAFMKSDQDSRWYGYTDMEAYQNPFTDGYPLIPYTDILGLEKETKLIDRVSKLFDIVKEAQDA